jgi:outer membrane protein TolC
MKSRSIPFLPLVFGGLLASGTLSALAGEPGAAPAPTSAIVSTPPEEAQAAESYVLPEYIRKPPAVPSQFSHRPRREISRHEAIELALRNNLGLELSREAVRKSDYLRRASYGAFEPLLQLSASRTKQQSPPATAQEGHAGQVLPVTSDLWMGSLTQTLPTATTLGIAFSSSRIDSALGSAVEPLLYRSTLTLTLNQPLLQNFSFNGHVQLAPVLRAEFDSETAREAARKNAIATIKSTEDLYWNLVSNWKAYEVKRATYDLAEKQVELTRRKIAAGTMPEADILKVESDLANRQVDMLASEAAIEDAADLLRQQLNLPAHEWEQLLLPLDAPDFKRVEVVMERVWDRALTFRPELISADIDMQRDQLALELARNARLPQLNLKGSLGTVGQDPDYGAALRQVKGASGWQWMVGADFSWAPLGIGTRARTRSAQSDLRTDVLGRAQLLTQIRYDLRAAKRNLDTAERQVYAAARSRDLAERSLEVEARKFLNGLSDNFKVALQQAALDSARLAELNALIAHEKARSSLLQATGELLEARQLRFEVRG